MGVPYRYVKEFMHPVVINGSYSTEPFYMYVWYRELELHRDGNRKIFEHFRKHGGVTTEADLGRGTVYGYELAHFVESTLDLMRCDIYAWLERPPQIRPYRN
jgi:aminoglycoside 3-N-acetyltransferase